MKISLTQTWDPQPGDDTPSPGKAEARPWGEAPTSVPFLGPLLEPRDPFEFSFHLGVSLPTELTRALNTLWLLSPEFFSPPC